LFHLNNLDILAGLQMLMFVMPIALSTF